MFIRQDSRAGTYACAKITCWNGWLSSHWQSLLSDVLTTDVSTPREMSLCGTSCLVIYDQATCDGPWKNPMELVLPMANSRFVQSQFLTWVNHLTGLV